MATKWKDLQHKASADSREHAKDEALAELAEVERAGVGALRISRKLTQVDVAETMHVPQSQVSRLEGQTDWYLSTLRKYVNALGGRLEMRAVFPDDVMDMEGLVSSIKDPR